MSDDLIPNNDSIEQFDEEEDDDYLFQFEDEDFLGVEGCARMVSALIRRNAGDAEKIHGLSMALRGLERLPFKTPTLFVQITSTIEYESSGVIRSLELSDEEFSISSTEWFRSEVGTETSSDTLVLIGPGWREKSELFGGWREQFLQGEISVDVSCEEFDWSLKDVHAARNALGWF